MDGLNHHFIRLGLTRAKALQTARWFPRETRHRFAEPKSNVFTVSLETLAVDMEAVSRVNLLWMWCRLKTGI
jgi:hypothetical protein